MKRTIIFLLCLACFGLGYAAKRPQPLPAGLADWLEYGCMTDSECESMENFIKTIK